MLLNRQKSTLYQQEMQLGSAINTTPTPSITKEVFILDGAGETLVLLGIVILETNLKVNGLNEFALLGFLGILEDLTDSFVKGLFGHLAGSEIKIKRVRSVILPVDVKPGIDGI